MMNGMYERPREGVTIPRIWLTVALSVLLHAAVLWQALPKLHRMTFDEPEQGANSGRLAVRLAPSPSPAVPAQPAEPPAPKVAARPPPPPRQNIPAPPVIALNRGPGPAPAPAPVPSAEPAPPRPPPEPDFATMVEARRRAREGAAPAPPQPSSGMIASAPAETEAERARRITSANLAPKQIVFGYDPAAGGGVFQIRRISISDADVAFYGWNREIKRKTMQIIEISKGNNSDIRIAVVRKMISIIREYESEEFRWESRGRTVTLSARLRDNPGLEEFMLREFFPDQAVAR
jgi:hypothetical protein